jgi:hypothetical protein
MSAAPGRHRIGARPEQVASRRWDQAERAAAAQLNLTEPAWLVMYGPGSRRFVAMAAWNVPQPLRVEALTVAELRHLMREAEMESAAVARGPSVGIR